MSKLPVSSASAGRFLRILCVVLCCAGGLPTEAAAQKLSMLRAQGPAIVDASNRPVVLRGINVGGWLLQESYILKTDSLDSQARIQQALLRTMPEAAVEKFYRQFRAGFITKADIDFIAKQGFNCVRLPFHYDLFLTAAQRRIRTRALQNPANLEAYVQALSTWYDQKQLFTDSKNLEGFRITDDVLNWCAANNLYVILDLHAAPGGQGADRNISDCLVPLDLWKRRDAKGRLIYQDITVRLWEKLSARYKNDARVAMYDFINEPNGMTTANGLAGDNSELNVLYSRLIDAVRAQGDQHLLLLEGNGYGNEYTNLTPDRLRSKDKRNLVYNAHRYWCPNTSTATDPNPNQINLIRNLAAFRDQWKVPVWVGETGENSNEWFSAAVQELNAHSLGWCHWTHKRVEGGTSLLRIPAYGSLLTPQGRTALLRNSEFRSCTVNKDVVAALMQPTGPPRPFAAHTLPGTIQASDYDLGRNGSAYYDTYAARTDFANHTPTNLGDAYRNDGVDIQEVTEASSKSFAVNHMAAGEWLNYTVTVPQEGTFQLQTRLRNTAPTPTKLLLKLNGKSVVATITAEPATGWQTLSVGTASMPAGIHTLQLYVEQPGAEIHWLRFATPGSALPSGQ
ncbi:cellulase family glycosylhydrolase [Microvirga sp. STR05]|uniref:Cellulase family glycosylhydrolase n=1 Tax=Hymenobacter duratus TaxID=2771356 RepID=A0ABR8JHN1_9BACT|nr:cellulase family glycosylhydrolase [Hymenobacter duratus]MBD2716362.1 cellulase family glycosylhydrolase [Hymenobacter duratus]MBR7951277.1 cellulase family glycosylhydrolase [Microvirga sp. STR05]